MEDGRYGASLRVSTALRDCAALTGVLGVAPDACFERGEPFSRRRPGARREEALWSVRSGLPAAEPLEAHLRAVLARVPAACLRDLPDDCSASWFCLVAGTHPTTLDAALLRDLAAAGAELGLDCYPPESGAGRRTAASFTTGGGDVLRSELPPAEPGEHHLAALLARVAPDPAGSWELTYASASGQGGATLDAPLLARLAAVDAPLTLRLV